MFVSHARVRIVGLGGQRKKRRFQRRRLGLKELIRMPCLLPTVVTVLLGLLAVVGGAGMSVLGYIPSSDYQSPVPPDTHTSSSSSSGGSSSSNSVAISPPRVNASQPVTYAQKDLRFYMLKTCSYLGPLLMAFGMFAMIVSCVFYCEILDKYSILVPDKRLAIYTKDELYEIIVGEMKKSYAQTLITAYTKAAERSMMMDNKSVCVDLIPEPTVPLKPTAEQPLSLEQQIDIECEGYTPSPPIPNKRYSVIQARIQRLRSEDNWLKTSSLPNIRRSELSSIRRAGRLRCAKKHSLSCDYTMDEARLRRKSMMLRSIILGHSSSSGDLPQRKSRRSSSARYLPSDNTMSLEEMSQGQTGSFPFTRLIQRRGTFACGDMRTRRMKFLLLLQASESKEKLSDTISMDGRHSIAAIRRNSFIPYTTCDRFIAGEEKKHFRERRTSVNPFTSCNRYGNPPPPPGLRRHSFFPIRREDQIYVSDPHEQRRHSYNPIAFNNTMKPEYAAKFEGRRGSYNPESSHESGRRESYVPHQKSNFLQVPGFENDPMLSERHPSASEDSPELVESAQGHSDSQFCSSHGAMLPSPNFHDSRMVERRHSYQPSCQISLPPTNEPAGFKVPQIVISNDANNRFLTVAHDYPPDERRHSFNAPSTTKQSNFPSSAAPPRHIERPVPQRISFKLSPENSPCSPPPHHTNNTPYSGSSAKSSKSSNPGFSSSPSELTRPSGFKKEIKVFSPLTVADSRSISPISNVSCCGSERIGSERSGVTGRTASISSERTARTVTPHSVVAPESMSREGSFERPLSPVFSIHLPLPVDVDGVAKKDKPDVSLSLTFPSSQQSVDDSNVPMLPEERERRSQHVATAGGSRHVPFRSWTRVTDSPAASTSSGPATLLPTSNTDANASLYRSRSASAISSTTENASDSSLISYATLSPSASTARPSVKDKTVRAKHKFDDNRS